MSNSEIAKLKKALSEIDKRISNLETEMEGFKQRIDDTCDALDKKYAALVESMKSISGVQSHAILHQIRSEMRIEIQKMLRDLGRSDLRY